MLQSLRARITAWYAFVLAVCLLVVGTACYVVLASSARTRTDEFLAETAAAVAGAMEYERVSGKSESSAIASVLSEFRLLDIDIFVHDRVSGVTKSARAYQYPRAGVVRSSLLPGVERLDSLLGHVPREQPEVITVKESTHRVRLFMLPYTLGRQRLVISATRSLADEDRLLGKVRVSLLAGIPMILVVAAAGGAWLARRSLAPVVELSRRADALGASNLHERLPVTNPRDELGGLASVFNRMIERIAGAFDEQRRFMAEASHDLRHPVTVISAVAEHALSRDDRDADAYRDALATVRAQARRLRARVDDLFLLAHATAGERPLSIADVSMREVVEESARSIQALAKEKNVDVRTVTDDDLMLRGDESLLGRLVMNLLDNAIRHTPEGGRIVVTARRQDGAIETEVQDSGAGIPTADQPRIFDRYYRGKQGGSAGLGLAIARWVAEAHAGSLTLVRSDREGTVLRIRLPALPD